jgi:hypothetical protein
MGKIISMLVFMLATLQCTSLYSKDVLYPNVRHAAQKNISIKKVNILGTTTQVDFLYRSNETTSRYIYLSLPKDGESMYIKIKDRKYKLLFTIGIANKDRQTICHPGQEIEFSAIFEAIPENTEELDIIEGDTGSWHFFGVQLESNNTNQQELCRLNIINAYENDRDITSIIKSRRAYLALYLDNGELCLANVHPLSNTQSWGKLIVEDYERARTDDGNIDKISYAKWYYQNSYDNKTGVAIVAIGQREYTNMAFIQISADNDILYYITEIQGSMDIIQRDKNVNTRTPKSKNSNTPNKRRTLQKNPNFKIE